ncbi:hypothetical protein R3W88_003835 [Solanum pinnatisectum]|uniref:Uncharacterized protein n=1 Tax=Solanum pinnatisectum TaxID=50273 RepID=A0AAV9MQ40_9SOLN|nr:hypothetical protein R3W88_003835 [Solanum pinnatisectum]
MDSDPTSNLSNTNRTIYGSNDKNWAEITSKSLHDPLNLMNQSIKDVPESSKPKVAKIPQKRGRKAAPAISRQSLPRNACSNIVPTPEELAAFDLPEDEHASPSSPPQYLVQSNDIANFDDFSTRPPEQLLRRSSRVSDTSSLPPPKRRKKENTPKVSEPSQPDQSNMSLSQPFSISDGPLTPATNVHGSADAKKVNYVISDIEELKDHLKNYVDKKSQELVILKKEYHLQLMRSRHKENNNVDPQSSNKQPSPHIQTDLADAVGVVDCEVGVFVNEVDYKLMSMQRMMKHIKPHKI